MIQLFTYQLNVTRVLCRMRRGTSHITVYLLFKRWSLHAFEDTPIMFTNFVLKSHLKIHNCRSYKWTVCTYLSHYQDRHTRNCRLSERVSFLTYPEIFVVYRTNIDRSWVVYIGIYYDIVSGLNNRYEHCYNITHVLFLFSANPSIHPASAQPAVWLSISLGFVFFLIN